MSQTPKLTSVKSKKSSKDREKRKSLAVNIDNNCSNANEKLSPIREQICRLYAGLSVENIKSAAEHITLPELVSDESCELLAEDLNYKLRYIIHQAANRAFISNRAVITSRDIEETFEDLNIDKVYGAPSDPLWIPLADQNYLYLDDPLVDLTEEIEEELSISQPADPIINKSWLPEFIESSKPLENYFRTLSEAVGSNDIEIRRTALQNISSNPNIGPIIDWFYKFGYILLSKDVTLNSLTLYALDLIETLEMSPLGSQGADEKQLKLLVRLILQRLLESFTNFDILRPMCWVLSILCRRYPLREFVLMKLVQKLPELSTDYSLPLLMIVNALGIDAISAVFMENIEFFIDTFSDQWHSLYGYTIMETCYILHKNGVYDVRLFEKFPNLMDFSIILSKPLQQILETKHIEERPFVPMKKQLILTRKKIEYQRPTKITALEDVFDISNLRLKSNTYNTYQTDWIKQSQMKHKANVHIIWIKSYSLKQKLENSNRTRQNLERIQQSHVEIGKTSILLPIFKRKSIVTTKCCDHSLFSYNF